MRLPKRRFCFVYFIFFICLHLLYLLLLQLVVTYSRWLSHLRTSSPVAIALVLFGCFGFLPIRAVGKEGLRRLQDLLPVSEH